MLTMSEYYSGAYNKVLKELPYWKREVVIENEKPEDRVIDEFLKEVVKMAEDPEFQKNFKN